MNGLEVRTAALEGYQADGAAAGLRRVLLNGSALLGAYVVPRGLTFAAALVAARLLGPARFGAYGTAASFAMILSILASLGMLPLLVRELARAPGHARQLLGAAHLIKGIASVAMVAAVYVISRYLLEYPPAVVQAAMFLALGHVFAAFAENLGAWFQAQERMHVWLEAQMLFGLIGGSVGIVLVVLTHSVPLFAAAFAAGQLVALLWLLQRLPASARGWSAHARSEARALLRATVPFAVAFLALTIFYKFDVLLLERLRDAGTAGIYAAGYKIVDVVHALAVVAAGAIYPRLARATTSEERTQASRRTLELFLLAGVAGSGALWLARTPLTLLLFGDAYAETAAVLGLLAPALAALVMNILAGYLLSAANRLAPLALAYLGGCLLKLLLGFWWIPQYGALGMALAKLVAECSVAVALVVVLARVGAGVPRVRTAALALVAAAIALLPVSPSISPLVVAGTYVTVVAIVYLRGQALSPEEWRALRSAIAPLKASPPRVAE